MGTTGKHPVGGEGKPSLIRRSPTNLRGTGAGPGAVGAAMGPGEAGLGVPRNVAPGRYYSVVDILILWGAVIENAFRSQHWFTFRQSLDLGGNVSKGERGITVCYADRFIPKAEIKRGPKDGVEPQAFAFLKRFTGSDSGKAFAPRSHEHPAKLR